MSFDANTLFGLLPAIHRTRDAELAASMGSHLTPAEIVELVALEALASPTPMQVARRDELRAKAGNQLSLFELDELRGLEALASPTVEEQARIHALQDKAARGPLKGLLTAFADELAVMEENLAQLYDDSFIETCADWTIPYIGDLIGYEPLHARSQARGLARAEVAHTIALRRRKGTAAVLEQLARDVTGWNARAVEYFQLLGDTQYMNHLRPRCLYAPDLRHWEPLARIGSAFESVMHTVDVRRIESRRGRFNIPNIGIFLWRINAYSHTRSPAVSVDGRRYLVSPLGHPLQLYTNPLAEDEITHLADPINVPDPIGRRTLADYTALYYGTRELPDPAPIDNADPSIVLYVNGNEVLRSEVTVCNLADDGAAWAHVPPSGKYAIDPVLGRIALAADLAVPTSLQVTYHYGFSVDIGGGEYPRERTADVPGTTILRVPNDHSTIQAALIALTAGGVVEITDNGRYAETLSVNVPADSTIMLRAAEQRRPTLILGGEFTVTGGANSAFILEGLLVAGHRLRVAAAGGLARLRIAHATLVPGRALNAAGGAVSPGAESLLIERPSVKVEVDRTILGALRVVDTASLSASDSIIDANASDAFAYCAPDGASPGGELSLVACTAIGKINANEMALISDSLLLARAATGDMLPPVHSVRRQTGCIRFSFLPFGSLTPRRFHCQPESAEGESNVAPRFVSLRYGVAAYCQLSRSTPDEIRRGASDESEMGAFHMLFPAQREANLQIRLREFLRVGLSSGIFYET
jgi:hypothetical protein